MFTSEAKRTAYLVSREAGANISQARRMAKLGPHGPSRLRHLFSATGSIRDRPRSGRPPIYTPQLFAAVEEVLKEDESTLYNSATLAEMLIHRGILHQGANKRAFMRAWEKYLRQHGRRLVPASTSTRFFLTPNDARERVKFAEEMLTLLADGEVSKCIFEDETTLEENPHPKSGLCKYAWAS